MRCSCKSTKIKPKVENWFHCLKRMAIGMMTSCLKKLEYPIRILVISCRNKIMDWTILSLVGRQSLLHPLLVNAMFDLCINELAIIIVTKFMN